MLSGRPGASRRRAPLRTGRAPFNASGSSKPLVVLVILRPYDPLADWASGGVRGSTHHDLWSGRLVCPLVRGLVVIVFLRGSPDHVSALSRRATRMGHLARPVIHDHQQEGADQHGRGCPSPFGGRRWLLGHPVPAQEFRLSSRSAYQPARRLGPRRGFHVSHARQTTGEGALYSPGMVVLFQADHDHRPAPGASQRRVPAPRHHLHHCAALLDEPSTRVQAILARPGLPLARDQRMDRRVLRFSPGLRTPRLLAAHAGAGTDLIEHGPEICSTASAEPPTSRIYLMRATSCRTRERRSLAEPRELAFRAPVDRGSQRPSLAGTGAPPSTPRPAQSPSREKASLTHSPPPSSPVAAARSAGLPSGVSSAIGALSSSPSCARCCSSGLWAPPPAPVPA